MIGEPPLLVSGLASNYFRIRALLSTPDFGLRARHHGAGSRAPSHPSVSQKTVSAYHCGDVWPAPADDGGRVLGGDLVTSAVVSATRRAVVVVLRRRPRAFALAHLAINL